MPTLTEIARHLDGLLRVAELPDYGNALNGIQVASDDEIVKVAAAVDARERTIAGAAAEGANLLLVHHGLFWGGLQPLQGPHLRKVRALLERRLALYAAHLPLDAHPELGNNVLLARALGLVPNGTWVREKGTELGVAGEDELPTRDLFARADAFARGYGGAARITDVAPDRLTRRWGICTGAGASSATLREAAERGIDTIVAGEGPHHTAIEADELGVAVIYAGHYATETLGVQALARNVAETFGIPWTFIHVPTGL